MDGGNDIRIDARFPGGNIVVERREGDTFFVRQQWSTSAQPWFSWSLRVAVASLEVPIADLTWRAGVDVVCFGGTKNGIGLGETVIFFNRELAHEFDCRCKEAGQLASKMRPMSARWDAALRSGRWLENARPANAMASRLAAAIAEIPGAERLHTTEANAVFVMLSEEANRALAAAGWAYYRFIGGGARFVCSWSTTTDDVDRLAAAIRVATTLPAGDC